MLNYTYNDFQEIRFEDFLDLIWSNYISEKIVSSAYYAENESFISAFTFDCYRLFEMDRSLTLRTISRMIESFFFNLFRYKGSNSDVTNMEDELPEQ